MFLKLYTGIYELARHQLGVSRDEYALCQYIMYRSADRRQKVKGFCCDGKESIAVFVGITRPGLYKMLDKLSEMNLIEIDPSNGFLRCTEIFVDTENSYSISNKTTSEDVNKVYNNKGKKGVNKVDANSKQSLHGVVNKVTPIHRNSIEVSIDSLNTPNPQISENVENGFSNHVEGKHSVSFTMSNEDDVQQTMFNQNHVEFTKHVEGQIDRYGRPCENSVEGYSAPVSPANGEELTEEDLNYYFGVSTTPVSQPAPAQPTNQAQSQTATKTKGARSRAQAAPAQDAGNEGGYTFDQFWKEYNYPKGSKANAREKFNKLSAKDRQTIQKYLWVYLENTSTTGEEKGHAFKRMRKNPEFFLSPKAKCWETLEEEAAQLENAEPPLRKPFHDMTHEQYTRYYGELFPEITLLTPEQLRTVKYTIFHENEKDLTRDEYFELMKKAHRHVKVYEAQKFDLFKVLTNLIKLKGESKNPV